MSDIDRPVDERRSALLRAIDERRFALLRAIDERRFALLRAIDNRRGRPATGPAGGRGERFTRDSPASAQHKEASGDMKTAAKNWTKEALSAVVPRRLLTLRGPARRRQVALTFDDGPDALTPSYLDVLERLGVPATFFLIGRSIAREPAGIVNEYIRRGHEVAAHGYTHLRFPRLSPAALRDELLRTATLLPPAAGPDMLRPPHGAISARSLLQCALLGYRVVLWSLNSNDYTLKDGAQVAAHLAAQPVRNGEIILLHEEQQWTVDALPAIVEDLRRRDFELVTVGQLLTGAGADRAP